MGLLAMSGSCKGLLTEQVSGVGVGEERIFPEKYRLTLSNNLAESAGVRKYPLT
jgi:hypothetical protein